MSNYPPGVTGNEYQIAGADYERESDVPCGRCGKSSCMEVGYGRERWLTCGECDWHTDLDPLEPDPDRAYDEERDRQMCSGG